MSATARPKLPVRVRPSVWEAADLRTGAAAAELYGVADAEPPAGMELVGWTWEYGDGSHGFVKPAESIRSRSQPVRMRPLFSPIS